jgi:hypothetical protein
VSLQWRNHISAGLPAENGWQRRQGEERRFSKTSLVELRSLRIMLRENKTTWVENRPITSARNQNDRE